MSLIACSNLAFSYENQTVVSGLSFQVNEGDYLCIVGENGTGKTTLIRGLLGLKRPSFGSLVFGEGLRSTQIGYVPQQDAVQKDFPASVQEVVLSGCLNARGLLPGYSAAQKKRAAQNLELLGIGELKNKSFQELSGGQRQRVLLARSLCAAERLLLLDEPTTGLDPLAIEEFYALMDSLNREHHMTLIMVSHAIREAVEHADHILHLSQDGSFFGTTQEYENSGFGRRFLGEEETGR
ncbi:MAG TPA: ABC transporter ATP-binding protein [Candidatus Eisenbergiella merdavium]|uniref:ABC transporter ATP-binding protein n=1 Tax=Candidatus Eisenbergiella merdavium TaxID=2838551 RepID=A0A9D2NEA3_9FIRM|nr:ABC transporter ATP-binding protein [Candidatus Eisenbergiella merdavium]